MIEALASELPIVASDIDTFRQFSIFEGVSLVDPNNDRLFSGEIIKFIESGKRYERNLDQYSVRKTASEYCEVARVPCKIK